MSEVLKTLFGGQVCTLEELLPKFTIISENDCNGLEDLKRFIVAYPTELPEFLPKPSEISMRQVPPPII
jgi:hypothetical protein